jgi:hypothetical protein
MVGQSWKGSWTREDNAILAFVKQHHPKLVRPREDQSHGEQQWVILILLYWRFKKSTKAIGQFLHWRTSTVERRVERIRLTANGLRQDNSRPHTGRPPGRPSRKAVRIPENRW